MAIFFCSYDPDIIEASLGHRNADTIKCAYNRSTDCDQRVQLMGRWADLVDHFLWRKQPKIPVQTLGISQD